MNVPHDKICPDCGTYMNWFKDHETVTKSHALKMRLTDVAEQLFRLIQSN